MATTKAKKTEVVEEEPEEEYGTTLIYKTGPITITGNNNHLTIHLQGEPPDPDPPEDDED